MILPNPLNHQRSLSVRIGRIVVRLVVLAALGWGMLVAYRAYVRHKLAQEIAPVHAYANDVFLMLQNGDYFGIQQRLPSKIQHEVSIDWLAHFVENGELNASTGLSWGDWNKTEANATLYRVGGTITYQTGHKNPIVWILKKEDANLTLVQMHLGKRRLVPTNAPSFP